MITTAGIAPYTLYRSSSPVDPSLNRNREADEALNGAGIVSVLNLADTAEEMTAYRQTISDAEIQRTADKVYRILEERLRREMRRSGR